MVVAVRVRDCASNNDANEVAALLIFVAMGELDQCCVLLVLFSQVPKCAGCVLDREWKNGRRDLFA